MLKSGDLVKLHLPFDVASPSGQVNLWCLEQDGLCKVSIKSIGIVLKKFQYYSVVLIEKRTYEALNACLKKINK